MNEDSQKREFERVDDLDALLSLPYDFRLFFDDKEEAGIFVIRPPQRKVTIH